MKTIAIAGTHTRARSGAHASNGSGASLPARTLPPELLRRMNAYWRAANYLSVGQIYLYDNPLLKEPLKQSHVKPLVVGHWGTTPGQNFIYVHLNRVIKKYDLDMFYISGPGHGGPALVGNTYLEGSYSEIYPNISQDEAGIEEAVHSILLPGRDFEPRCADNPGLDPPGGKLAFHHSAIIRSANASATAARLAARSTYLWKDLADLWGVAVPWERPGAIWIGEGSTNVGATNPWHDLASSMRQNGV